MNQIGRNDKAGCAHEQQAAGGPFYVGLIECAAQTRSKLDPQKKTIDPGNGAEQFMFADVDVLVFQLSSAYGQGGSEQIQGLPGSLRGAGSARGEEQSDDGEDTQKYKCQ